MSKTNMQMVGKDVPSVCDCDDFGICAVEENSNDSINIGLIATCAKVNAGDFFSALRNEHYENFTGFSEISKGICRNCLRDFICDNELSVLFLEDKLMYEGVLVQETDGIISFIGELLDCEVRFMRKTR